MTIQNTGKPPDTDDLLAEIQRTARDDGQHALFDYEPAWADYWAGMPAFSAADITPTHEITLQFTNYDDYMEFRQQQGLQMRKGQRTAWWPPQQKLTGDIYWQGTPSSTRYPIFIPSKGRADVATTPRLLEQAGADYRLVVEPPEADAYRAAFGDDKVLVLPFQDLGQGSIPARNWIWDLAVAAGFPWHWIIDDNVLGFWRSHHNRRLVVRGSSAPLRAVENFADRHDNLAFTGLAADGFMPDTMRSPITFNTRVYSVTLINTALPYRWRGRYNEDTDICLRALKDGWSTALFRCFLMKKAHTANGAGAGGMKGGNTDHVYNDGDYRRAFAESLKEQHPDVVDVVWKFQRWHHEVDYTPFKRNQLVPKEGLPPVADDPDYGLRLVRGKNDPNPAHIEDTSCQ
jgi:hypothetical protein